MIRSKLFILCLLFSGCTLAPRYSRQTGPIPSDWRISTDNTYAETEVAFWKQLGDDVLNQLIDQALTYNQDLKVAIYTVKEFEARYGIVSSQLYPQVNGSGDAGRFKLSENFVTTVPNFPPISNFFDLALNASYLVDIWGKVRSASQSSYAEMLAQVEVRRTVVIAVVTGVAESYIEMRKYDEQLRIANETLVTREQSFKLATTRFELGLTSEMQVEQAKSELEDAQIEVDRLRIAIAIEEDLLCLLLGQPSMTPPRGKAIGDLLLPATLPAYVPSTIINQRPDILKAEQQLIAANADIGVARAKFLPEFNLLAAYGAQSSSLSNFFTNASNIWTFGANLLQEIFTGGRLISGLKLANSKKLAMLHAYQQSILTGLKEINDALISHKISKELVIQQKERVATLSTYFKLATYQYIEGLTDYLTYLDAERHLFQAQLDYAASLAYSLSTFVSIYQSSGGAWVTQADTAALQSNHGN